MSARRDSARGERNNGMEMKKMVGLRGGGRRSRRLGGSRLRGKREDSLVEDNMSGDNKTTRSKIETLNSFLEGRVTEKDARRGTRREFMRGGRGDICVAEATENVKVRVGRRRAKQDLLRSKVVKSFSR